MITLPIPQVLDLNPLIPVNGKLVDIFLDTTGITTLILVGEMQYRAEEGGFSFPLTHSQVPKDYLVLRHDLLGNLVSQTKVEQQRINFHFARHLSSGEILLVCARMASRGPLAARQNAHVVDLQGRLLRAFVLGDAINDIMPDSQGQLWTSYFDEGLSHQHRWAGPNGNTGLIHWGRHEKPSWVFEDKGKKHSICDCYAMNIDAADNCWIYYHSGFPLVKINAQRELQGWDCPVPGARTLNVDGYHVLLGAGWDQNHATLFDTQSDELVTLAEFSFVTPDGIPLGRRAAFSSLGALLGFEHDNKVYLTQMTGLQSIQDPNPTLNPEP